MSDFPTWSDITSRDNWSTLSRDEQYAVRDRYFSRFIAPTLNDDAIERNKQRWDELTRDSINTQYLPGSAEELAAVPRSAAAGFSGAIGSAVRGVGALADIASDRLPDAVSDFRGPGMPFTLRELGAGYEATGEALSGAAAYVAPEQDKATVASDVSGAMGSLAGFIAPRLIPGVGQSSVAGSLMTGTMAVGAGADEARQRAVQAGASEDDTDIATLAGILPGSLEMAPVELILRRVPPHLRKQALRDVARVVTAGAAEAGTEQMSGMAQNAIAKYIYDPEQGIMEDTVYNAAIGGTAAGLIQAMMLPAQHRAARIYNGPIRKEDIDKAQNIREASIDGIDQGQEAVWESPQGDIPVTYLGAVDAADGDLRLARVNLGNTEAYIRADRLKWGDRPSQDPKAVQAERDAHEQSLQDEIAQAAQAQPSPPADTPSAQTEQRSESEVRAWAAETIAELESYPDLDSNEAYQLQFLRQNADNPRAIAQAYGVDMIPDGMRSTARSQVQPLTPEDEASPIPNELIAQGRSVLADAGGQESANQALQAEGLPPVGSRVTITLDDGQVTGVIDDAHANGPIIKLDSGRIVAPSYPQVKGRIGAASSDLSTGQNVELSTELSTGKTQSSTGQAIARPVLQNRDRSTPAMISQMRSIAANPDYGRMGFSRDFANGAPVVEPGADIPASQMGRTDYAVTGKGRRIPVQYAVVDASQLLASNRADGSMVPEYESGAEGVSRAIAGNGRTAGIQAAYSAGQAQAYRDAIAADDLHGISPDAIASVPNPVLVRIMPADAITQDIGDESNITGTSALSGVDQARNDSRRIDVAGMSFGQDGEITADTVRQFVRSMPQSEQAGLMDGGQPSRQAYDRLTNAIFATAYNSDALVRLQAQATDPEARNILKGLTMAASQMAQLEGTGVYDIRPLVAEAAELAVNAKRSGRSLGEYISQVDLAASGESLPILKMFADNIRSARAIGESLARLAGGMQAEAIAPDADMFGTVQKRSPDQITQEVFGGQPSTPVVSQPTRPAATDQPAQARQAEAERPADTGPVAATAERPGFPARISIGLGSITPKPIGKALYRETNGDGLDSVILGTLTDNSDGAYVASQFFTDNPDLALGQGGNQGILIQFRPGSVSGSTHSKPGTSETVGQEYRSDAVARDAIDQIVAKKGTKIRPLTRTLIKRNFDAVTLANGDTLFTRKGVDVGQPLNELRMADRSGDANKKVKPKKPDTESSKGLPDILTTPRAKYLRKMAAESGIKKGSPGYGDAMLRLADRYETEVDRAQASLTLEQFNRLNPDSPPSVNRQAWESLRDEYGVSEPLAPYTEQDLRDREKARKEGERTRPTKQDDGEFVLTGSDREADQAAARGQRDLFTGEPQADMFVTTRGMAADKPVARTQAVDNFNIRYEQVEASQISVGLTQIKSPGDAAHILAAMRKDAQEKFIALVTDADGNVINAIDYSKGTKSSSSVNPLEVVGAIASTKGGVKVWFGHHHPSGSLKPSDADFKITKRLIDALDGVGTEFMGHVIVAPGTTKAALIDADGGESRIAVTAAPRGQKLSLTERKLRMRMQRPRQVASPSDAIEMVRHIETDDAIILMDYQNSRTGVIALSSKEMKNLREGGNVRRILSAMDSTNSPQVMIKTSDAEAARNLVRFFNNNGAEVLDWIYLLNGEGVSAAQKRSPVLHDNSKNFYSLEDGLKAGAFRDTKTHSKQFDISGRGVEASPEFQTKIFNIVESLRARAKELNLPDNVTVNLVKAIDAVGNPITADVTGGKISPAETVGIIDIALGARDHVRTLNHEVVHALKALGLFRPAEWSALEKAAKSSPRRDEIAQRYKDQGLTDAQLAEEVIAEMYADWAGSQSGNDAAQTRGFVRTAFDRITAFFKAIADAFTGRGLNSIDQIFSLVESGEVGARQQPRNDKGQFVKAAQIDDAGVQGSFGQPGDYSFKESDYRKPVVAWAKERFGDQVAPNGKPAWQNFVRWFGDSKVVDSDGKPLVVYHGTGNTESILDGGFKPALTGLGMDQLGSGFYFTTDQTEAKGYQTALTQNIRHDGKKLGGSDSPGTIEAFLTIKNPVIIQGSSLNDSGIELTKKQVASILKYSESAKGDDSPFGDFFEEFWDSGVKPWMYSKAAENYEGRSLISLENDFFRGESPNFREAIRDVLGYDGVIQKFDGGRVHVVAWFPAQIKSATGNTGDFSAATGDIRYSRTPVIATKDSVRDMANRVKKSLGLETLSVLYSQSGNSISIINMVVPEGSRGVGVGSEAVRMILDFADSSGLTVTLTPATKDDAHGTTSRRRLIDFYKRFGFVENKGRNKDFSISDGMYREPTIAAEGSFRTAGQPTMYSLKMGDFNPDQARRVQEAITGQRQQPDPSHQGPGGEVGNGRVDSPIKSALKLVGLFESATDRLRRSKDKRLTALAAKIDAYYDKTDARVGKVNSRIKPILDRLGIGHTTTQGRINEITRPFAEYWQHHDNGRRAEAEAILAKADPAVRDLIDATKDLFSDMGDTNQQLGIQVYDANMVDWAAVQNRIGANGVRILRTTKPSLQRSKYAELLGMGNKQGQLDVGQALPELPRKGGWRLIGKVKRGEFWPRAIRPEVQRAMANPNGNKELWAEITNALINEGHIRHPHEAVNYTTMYFANMMESDYFAGIEKARTTKLPEIFYDYSWNAFQRYTNKWANRTSQIEEFGQVTAPGTLDAFDAIITSHPDPESRNYVGAVRDLVYSRRPTDSWSGLLENLNVLATGLQLGNPATATLNLLGGTTLSIQMFGWKRVAKAYAELMSDYKNIQAQGVELGILGKDVLNILRDTESGATYFDNTGRMKDMLSRFTNTTMTWGGYRAAENVVRATTMIAARLQLQDALRLWNKKPDSSDAAKYRGMMARHRLDVNKLIMENGQGDETAKYLRLMVNIPQGSYRLDNTPVYVDTTLGRFMFKYQKFGTQVSRMFWQNFLHPFVEKPSIKTFLPIASFFSTAFLGGAVVLAARTGLFAYQDPGPDWEDLADALQDEDKARALAMIYDRAYANMMAVGALGFFGNYIQFASDTLDQQRVKNPLDPPGLASIDAAVEITRRIIEQGTLTSKDVDDVVNKTFSLYRGYKKLGLRGLEVVGADIDASNLQAVRRDIGYIRQTARRYAEEAGIEAKQTSQGRFAKTPRSPVNTAVSEAILLGDSARAKLIAQQAMVGLTSAEKESYRASLRAAVRNRQPIMIAGSPSQAEREAFLKWARKNVSPANYQRILQMDAEYRRTAIRAGIW